MGLERLRPMLWWCNLTGILPFGMELQPGPNGPIYKRVTFSFKSPAIWWSIIIGFLLVGNLSALTLTLVRYAATHKETVLNRGIDFADWAARFHYAHYAALTVVSFFLVTKHKIMKEVVEDVNLVDSDISAYVKPTCKTTSMTIIAFMVTCVWVTVECLITLKPILTDSVIAKTMGPKVALSFLMSNTAMEFRTITLFAAYLMSNYVVANRISLLVTVINEYNPSTTNKDGQIGGKEERKLHTTKFLFNRICRASANLGKCFALPIAIALVFKIVSCTLNLFLFVCHAIVQNNADLKIWAFQFVSDTLFTIILFAAADLPADQVGPLREKLMDISTAILSNDDKYEIMSFLQLTDENRVRLSTYGIFSVGKSLLPSLIGVILTYMIVLVQTSMSNISTSSNIGNATSP